MTNKQSVEPIDSILSRVAEVRGYIDKHPLTPSEAMQAIKELWSLEGALASIIYENEEQVENTEGSQAKLYNAIDCDNSEQVFASNLFCTLEAAEISLGIEAIYRNVGSYKIDEAPEMPDFSSQVVEMGSGFEDIDASLANLNIAAMGK